MDRKVDEVLDQVPLTVMAELVGMLGTCHEHNHEMFLKESRVNWCDTVRKPQRLVRVCGCCQTTRLEQCSADQAVCRLRTTS
jgi:hypothetical protein